MVHSFDSHDERLVAHIQITDASQFNELEVLKYLRKILPRYMIPQHFEMLERFPTNVSGKLDRSQLVVRNLTKRNKLALETEWQREIAGIWARELQVDTSSVGLNDHFFELGGHSMIALAVVTSIEAKYAVQISPATLLTRDFETFCADLELLLHDRPDEKHSVSRNPLQQLLHRWFRR